MAIQLCEVSRQAASFDSFTLQINCIPIFLSFFIFCFTGCLPSLLIVCLFFLCLVWWKESLLFFREFSSQSYFSLLIKILLEFNIKKERIMCFAFCLFFPSFFFWVIFLTFLCFFSIEITSRWNEVCFLKRTQNQNTIMRA